MVIGECDICAQHRDGRCRVRCLESDTRHEEKPFTDAPYLHPFNHPRYHALLLRAVRFARAHGRILIWYRCEDKPYKGVDDSLRGEQLERRRQTWLKYSDDKTAGIVGLLPLVRLMPLRCTDTIDRERNIFKHTRCTLEGWELDPIDAQILDQCTEPEYVLTLPPRALHIRANADEFALEDGKQNEVQRIEPVTRSWSPDAAGNVQVNRRGFQVVPNFAGTIHSFVGATLEAAMQDCLHFSRTPSREDMLKAYLGISRVKTKEGLLIVQPYHPMLFRQGALPGPELLMQLWRGHLRVDELAQKWEEYEDAAGKLQKRLDKMT